MKSKILAQGAEAVIRLENQVIVKDRTQKTYRLKILDDKIRKLRTRSEAKILEKANKVIFTPKVLEIDEKNGKLKLEHIKGKRLSDCLDNLRLKFRIMSQVGKLTAILHNNNIIHGDLTTSNMILVENLGKKISKKDEINNKVSKVLNKSDSKKYLTLANNKSASVNEPIFGWVGGDNYKFKIFFIDFGLSFISHKIEDKAVDIHLIMEALEAKHFKHFKEYSRAFLQGYKSESKDFQKIMERLKAVEKRGRYKERY